MLVIQEHSRRSFKNRRGRRNITVVTQQRIRELKEDLSITIKLVNDFINTSEWNIALATNVYEKPMTGQLNLFSSELTDYGDTLPENDENDKHLEQYEEAKTEAKAILTRSQQIISQKEGEQEEKEKQLV